MTGVDVMSTSKCSHWTSVCWFLSFSGAGFDSPQFPLDWGRNRLCEGSWFFTEISNKKKTVWQINAQIDPNKFKTHTFLLILNKPYGTKIRFQSTALQTLLTRTFNLYDRHICNALRPLMVRRINNHVISRDFHHESDDAVLLPGRGCCAGTCRRSCNPNGRSSPWSCNSGWLSPRLFPRRSIRTWSTPCRRPAAAAAQTAACSPNTGGGSSPARLGGATAARGERSGSQRHGARKRSVGSWCGRMQRPDLLFTVIL